ncbi:MAG: FkbM family methyltransferase [Myxococcales bacterium]|nr:FkbM family methyltransferase [Myxococcales bacterium]
MIGPGSAFGQDRWVLDVLGGQRGGFFLDSGASDGVRGSNSLVLERDHGWRGICVEPNPRFFERLVAARRCRCVNACLYDRDGEVEFVDAEVLGGIAADYPPSLVREAQARYGLAVDAAGRPATVRRPARAIRGLLRACGAPPVIDYWSLDTEGSELSILAAFPWDEFAVRTLTVEHNWLPARDAIHEFLTARGYVRVRELVVDDCYVRADEAPAAAWRSGAWRRRRAA